MADLGAIGKALARVSVIEFPFYAVADIQHRLDKNSQIRGTVTESSAPVAGVKLFLLWRPTMTRAAWTVTDKDGNYAFKGLDSNIDNYVVVCQDPPGGTIYNDKIYALVVPS